LIVRRVRSTVGFPSAAINDRNGLQRFGPGVAHEGVGAGPFRRPSRWLLGRGPSLTRKEGRGLQSWASEQ
jgi:hypothetical protein